MAPPRGVLEEIARLGLLHMDLGGLDASRAFRLPPPRCALASPSRGRAAGAGFATCCALSIATRSCAARLPCRARAGGARARQRRAGYDSGGFSARADRLPAEERFERSSCWASEDRIVGVTGYRRPARAEVRREKPRVGAFTTGGCCRIVAAGAGPRARSPRTLQAEIRRIADPAEGVRSWPNKPGATVGLGIFSPLIPPPRDMVGQSETGPHGWSITTSGALDTIRRAPPGERGVPAARWSISGIGTRR